MKTEIYIDDELINLSHISITNFDAVLFAKKRTFEEFKLDFSSIKSLKGEKIILDKAFIDEKMEILNP